MKRCLALLILCSLPALHAADKVADVVSTIVKNTAGQMPAKERIKTIGSVCFSVSGLLYIIATHQEHVKFKAIVASHKASLGHQEHLTNKNGELDIVELSQKEGAHNIWSGLQTLAACGLVGGSFLLGMSMEDTFNLI